MFIINGIEWNVVFSRPNSAQLARSDGSLTVGMTDWKQRTIFLSDALYGTFLRKVFIHEVCHAACFSYDIQMDIEQEEFLCDFVATYGDEIFQIVDAVFVAIKNIA